MVSIEGRLVRTVRPAKKKEGTVEGPEIKFAEVEIDNGIHGKRHVRFLKPAASQSRQLAPSSSLSMTRPPCSPQPQSASLP